jgi:uncharacterized membrane protein
MNAINVDIVRSLFMPLFLGGTLAAAALAVMAILRWGEPGAMVMLAGGVLYVVGMFVVTMVFNVPLNDALAAADPSSPKAASLWARYLKDWTFAATAATYLLDESAAGRAWLSRSDGADGQARPRRRRSPGVAAARSSAFDDDDGSIAGAA